MPWLRTLAVILLLGMPVLAADWPGWLGPHRDGRSTEVVKPWKGDLKVVWRQAVGPGHSSPVVAGGRVFLHAKVADKEAEEVIAWDAVTGKELWRTPYPRDRFWSPFGTGPQSTPSVVDGKLYAYGATGIMTCFDAGKGTQLWQNDTSKTFMAPTLFFGAACSPLVDGDKVMVSVGAKGASLVAFERDTGKVAWKVLDDKASYSSPIIYSEGTGKERSVLFLTQEALRALDPANGSLRWSLPFFDKLNETSTTPVVAGDLLLLSSITQGTAGVKMETKDKKPAPTVVWRNKELTCYFSTPIPIQDHVYLVTGKISFAPISSLHCIERKTGKVLWTQEKIGKYHAALLRTGDDKLLMLTDLGQLILLDPSPAGYKELAKSQVVKKEQIWAHPALANGKVYLRDEKEILCLQIPE
jgi:outer membrane protein assembly factor BamB